MRACKPEAVKALSSGCGYDRSFEITSVNPSRANGADTFLGGSGVRTMLDRQQERFARSHCPRQRAPVSRAGIGAFCEERGVRLEFIQPGKPVQLRRGAFLH